MKKALTDSALSLDAREFVWAEEGLSEAHAYLLPTVRQWLLEANAKRILDLGCGNAAMTADLAKDGFQMTGADISESGLAIAAKSYPQLELVPADLGRELPERLFGRFDAVVAIEVIEHLFLPRLLFQRAREALTKGGILVVSTPYHGYFKNLAIALANGFDVHWHPLRDCGHVKFFSVATLNQLFAEQGFPVSRFRRTGRWPPLAKSMIIQGSMLSQDQ